MVFVVRIVKNELNHSQSPNSWSYSE